MHQGRASILVFCGVCLLGPSSCRPEGTTRVHGLYRPARCRCIRTFPRTQAPFEGHARAKVCVVVPGRREVVQRSLPWSHPLPHSAQGKLSCCVVISAPGRSPQMKSRLVRSAFLIGPAMLLAACGGGGGGGTPAPATQTTSQLVVTDSNAQAVA